MRGALVISPRARLAVGSAALGVIGLAGIGWTYSTHRSHSTPPAIAAFSVEVPARTPNPFVQSVQFASLTPGRSETLAAQPAYAAPAGHRLGAFAPPLGGWVTQVFGPTTQTIEPALVYNGVAYAHFHTGLDIEAPTGTPVGASAAGVVVTVGAANGRRTGYGNFVVIRHRLGYESLYGHLERVTVTVGEQVHQLDLIGFSGSTGLSTGPHLHFEIRRYGTFLDPLPYLLGRLQPW